MVLKETGRLAEAVEQLYAEGHTDYYLPPIVVTDQHDAPVGRVSDGDSVIFCFRRGERETQLTRAFVDPGFKEHPVKEFRKLTFVPLTLYDEAFSRLPVAFPPLRLKDTLGEVVARHGLKQVRIAESEKFSHVTFFLNGGWRPPFAGEEDICIPSKRAECHLQNPELSVAEVTASAVGSLAAGRYHLAVVNIANGDIIGHLEDREANLRCAEAIDRHLGMLLEVALGNGYVSVITADHGVFEQMVTPNGRPSLGHTRNPVPFSLVGEGYGLEDLHLRSGGKLANVAPTVLEIIGLAKSDLMTCRSLIERKRPRMDPKVETDHRRVLLLILDGCGVGSQDASNPLFSAPTPVMDWIRELYPYTELMASGRAVGLLEGKSGNSEAGHMNLAAGRVAPQDDVRIDRAIRDGSFMKNQAFRLAIKNAKLNHGALHLVAMLSTGSSHGSMEYALALLRLARKEAIEEVNVHVVFDGRSTEAGTAPMLLRTLGSEMEGIGVGRVVSGVGRAFALDRDRDYLNKTRVAYEALVLGRAKAVPVDSL